MLRAVARCHLFVGETLTPYVAEAISNTILNARRDELPLSMSLYNYRMLRLKGDMKENPFLHICSLDRPMVGKDGGLTIADTLAAPPLEPIIGEAGEQDEKQALVEALLARVTERQRQLLRLRYGLDPSDAREHSNSEIAAKLQLSETNVCETLQRAIKACRRFSEEFAAKGRSRVQQVPQAPLTVLLHGEMSQLYAMNIWRRDAGSSTRNYSKRERP